MQARVFLLWLLILLVSVNMAYASHIAGGDMSYTCTNGRYRIILNIYQDCVTGEPTAIREDTPARIGIFNLDNMTGELFETSPSSLTFVEPNFRNECVNNPPPTCLNRLSFTIDRVLPPNNNGYRIIYQRCCRNAQTLNIDRPDQTGASYFIDIPPANVAECNNSAVFKNNPPQIICINNPLVYDHSATDADGDSLSYEFCAAFSGGSLDSPKPFPSPAVPKPLTYVQPFTPAKPMGGNPTVQINPKTGMITGTPNTTGRFVVNVCCHEWRNGTLINTTRREFQFVVTNCSKAVVANIPQFSTEFNTYIVECNSFTVKFINHSTGGFAFDWSFGVPGATSNDFEPTFTYPDTGTYVVKLIVNRGSTCPDSITRLVKVYPSYSADYVFSGLKCPNAPIQFEDRSVATFNPIIGWEWNFGDGNTSGDQNPVHAFGTGGNYNVTLISSSIKGCRDTVSKTVNIPDFKPFAGNDTIIVKGETINFNATGGIEYTWTPPDKLSSTNISDPSAFFPDTGRFAYNVHIKSENGCQGDDSIRILVVSNPAIFVPSGFTPNGDGINDFLRPIAIGYSKIRFFRVFNRFGQMVYQTSSFDAGWDGVYNNKHADLGTYFWLLGVTDRFGKDDTKKGDATLIR